MSIADSVATCEGPDGMAALDNRRAPRPIPRSKHRSPGEGRTMDDHARALDEFEHIKARIYRILGDGLRELAFASTAVSMAELRMRLEAMRHYFVLGDRVDALVADFADGKRTRQETIARVRELAQEEAERVGYSSAAELLADKESEG